MTTEEFENNLCNLGYNPKRNADWITVFDGRNAIVVEVNVNRFYALHTDYFAFTDDLEDNERQALIQVIDAYIKTPVAER